MSKWLKDVIERVLWTAAEAAVGVLAVTEFDWAGEWAVVIAAGVAVLKGIVARHVGDKDSASTAPGV